MTDKQLENILDSASSLPDEVYGSVEKFAEAIESYTAELELLRLRQNYRQLTSPGYKNKYLTDSEKQRIRLKSEVLCSHPIIDNLISQYASYSFGNGFPLPKASNGSVQEVLTRFWNHPDNRKSITKLLSQDKLTRKVFTTGELIIVMFVSFYTSNVCIRIYDSDDLQEIIFHPLDADRPIFYRFLNPQETEYDYSQNKLKMKNRKKTFSYFADYENVDWVKSFENKEITPIHKGPEILAEGVIYFTSFNNDIDDKRGVPLLKPILDYIEKHKEVEEQFSTYTRAVTTYAAKKKAKNVPVNVLQNFMNANRPVYNQDGTMRNSKPPVGSTMIENENIDYDLIDIPTSGSTVFEKMLSQILTMASAGSGISKPNLTNTADYGSLSKDSALELPQLMRFQKFQFLMKEIYTEILNTVLIINIAGKRLSGVLVIEDKYCIIKNISKFDYSFKINLPSILNRSINQLASALTSSVRELGMPKEVALDLMIKEFDLTREDISNIDYNVLESDENTTV